MNKIVITLAFLLVPLTVGAGYGYGAYGGVNSVVNSMLVSQLINKDNKTKEVKVEPVRNQFVFENYDTVKVNNSSFYLTKFTDENENLCYVVIRSSNGISISCIKK